MAESLQTRCSSKRKALNSRDCVDTFERAFSMRKERSKYVKHGRPEDVAKTFPAKFSLRRSWNSPTQTFPRVFQSRKSCVPLSFGKFTTAKSVGCALIDKPRLPGSRNSSLTWSFFPGKSSAYVHESWELSAYVRDGLMRPFF